MLLTKSRLYIPKTPEEWAEQALLQAHSTPVKAMAEMELLRGVEFQPVHGYLHTVVQFGYTEPQ